jgi:hypothetical protein
MFGIFGLTNFSLTVLIKYDHKSHGVAYKFTPTQLQISKKKWKN